MTWFALATWTAKELRALGPLWLACAFAVSVHDRLPEGFLPMLSVLAYLFGSAALGAQSIGHEYGHRTIGVMLALPVERRRIFVVKLAVLAVLLGGLAFVASWTVFDARPLTAGFTGVGPSGVAALVALGAASVAPALTMLTRSALAGLVLTIALPGVLWTGAVLVGAARFGVRDAATWRFAEAIFWPGMLGICALAAAASWRLFARLEAIEGGGSQVEAPRWLRRRAAMVGLPRRRSVVTELVLKELHLYQLPIAVAVLYAAAVPLVYAYVLSDVFVRGAILGPLTILYVFSIAALTGSLASAQERQLGTLEWQTLLPLAARRQWMVKLAVALLVVLVLAFGVPAGLLMVVQPAGQILGKAEPIVPPAVLLFAGSIYVSSLCTGGVRALAVSLPTLLGVALLLHWIVDWTSSIARHLAATSYFGIDRAHPPYGRIIAWGFLASGVLVIGGAFAEFAYRNHRSSERPWSRVAAQALVLTMIAAVVLAAGFVLGV